MTEDIQSLILSQLKQIVTDVHEIPKMQAQIDAMKGATQQLETAMRETTAGLRTQGEAHGKIIDELRLQVHQSLSAMMAISNDVQGLTGRVKDLEKQTTATFQQQMQLARDVRDTAINPDEYDGLKHEVETTLPKLRETISGIQNEMDENRPWLTGVKWFLRILFYALASSSVAGLLWLLGRALTSGL